MTPSGFCTIKCGGSLLDQPDLAARLLALIDMAKVTSAVVIVGGGSTVDVVRDWDRRFHLSARDAHRLAIHAMSLNARLLATLHERFVLVSHIRELSLVRDGQVAVPDVASVLNELEQTHSALPASWDVTSDSIAAWFATVCDSAELLLLKSVDLPPAIPPDATAVQHLVERSLVDPYFAQAASRLSTLRWCNLSSSRPVICSVLSPMG
ncbi:MAG: hypothetical protein R3C59_19825 [Planctomycetaceae bacterium]